MNTSSARSSSPLRRVARTFCIGALPDDGRRQLQLAGGDHVAGLARNASAWRRLFDGTFWRSHR
jgi:hypothetical protein